MFGAIAHYAESNVDKFWTCKYGVEDGSIGHVELNTTIKILKQAIGYIKTDKMVE